MPQPASSRRPAKSAPRPRARATPAAALHAVFELSEAALLLLDAAGCLTRANAPAAALLGQPAAALAGARLADLLPAEAGEPLLSAVAAAEPQRARRCTLRPAGGPPADFWLDVTPLPAGCLLRLRPAASPAADQPFADLFHRAPDALGISHWDSGQYLLINDAFTTLTGYPAADVLGRTLLELGLWVNPAERDVLRERVRAGGEVNNVEVQLRRRDGQVFAALISARLLEYAGATCILLAARDISERYQMEAALRASEERYRLVSELASDFAFSFSVGPDGQPRLEWITDAWTRATGYSREAAARSATWRQVIHPDDYPAVERALAEVLAGQSREIEARVVRADGALRRQLIRGHPRRDSVGRVVGLYGAAQDITAHLQAEAGRRETETRQRALLNAMPDDMFRFTLDGTFLDFHSNNLASLAMAPDSIRGARLDQSPLPPEFAARVLAAARQAVRTGQLQTLEYSLALPAGPRWFEARLAASGPDEAVAVVRDVTARRQADEALRASEERYRLISELMSDFAFAYDFNPDGSARLAWITAEAFTRLTGQPADRAADLYNFLGSSAVLPEDVPLVAAAVQRARAGEAVETEWRMYTEAGELRWLRTAARPRLDSAGRVAGIFGAIHDITAAKQAEQARRESEALGRSILDVLSEGVVVQDQAGAIIFSNASAEQILGLTTDQMAGRSSLDPRWRSIYPDGTPLPGIDHPAMVALRTGEPQTDVIMGVHRPDGTLVWISINSRPVDAAHTQVATSFTDITRRRQTETALQAELAFRQALEETLPTGLAVADVRDHAIIYVNPGLCQLLGYPAEELLNDRPPYKYWPSELAAAYQAAFARALADQLPAEGLELTFRRKSGERFQALVVTALVRDAAQQPRGLLASISDITPLRRAADALQRSNQRLEALRALSRSILAARSPAQVAASALQHLRPLVPHDNAWLFMYEAASPEPVCLASAGVSDAWTQPDPALELDQAGWRDLPSGAWLVVPVWTGSQLVGSLILADGAAGRFSQSELDIAAEVVDELAVALQQARLLQAEMRRRQELEAIADVSAALRLATSSAAVAQILVAQAVALMHAEGGVLLAGQTTWTVLAVWHAADSPAAPPPALDEAAVRLLRGDAPGAPDFQAEPAPNRTQLLRRLLPEALAYASAPLRVAEQLPGLLVLGWSRPPAFGTPDQHLLAAVTELGSNALQRSNLLETLERRVAARTHDLMALYDVAALATETLDRPALLQRALMYGLQATG
ncbi:MAG: PAS domain S-box protein, partial [Anaerolineales bacterium]|nr:PAS domain S-box protein [Anaerolineales bacterium]